MLYHPPGLIANQPPANSSSGAPQVVNTAAAAVTIQAAVRAYLCRQRQQQLKSAAVLIQARWRGHTCHKNFQLLRDVATIQAEGDSTGCLSHIHLLQLDVEVRRFLQMTRAATRVQAAFRGYRTRQQLLMLHNAATKIQTAVRGHVCRQRWLHLQPTAALTVLRRKWQRQRMHQV